VTAARNEPVTCARGSDRAAAARRCSAGSRRDAGACGTSGLIRPPLCLLGSITHPHACLLQAETHSIAAAQPAAADKLAAVERLTQSLLEDGAEVRRA
jgi:hypothetical protein